MNISWLRNEDTNAGFAVVGTSTISSTDLVKGAGLTSVSNPDIYDYVDETDKVISIDYDRKIIEPTGGMSTAIMTVVLDNIDGRYSPNQNATIGTAVLPKRPINMHIGFRVQGQDKTITLFKGLTRMPQEDKQKKTVTITAVDYVSYLDKLPLDAAKYTNERTDEIIDDILTELGFGSAQYILDTGLNTIGFAYFDKGVSAGYRIRELCESEEAVFYQDENGVLRFENRQHYALAPHDTVAWTVDGEDIIEWKEQRTMRIINKCVVKATPRVVQADNAIIWEHPEKVSIGAGLDVTVWANLNDPADSIVDPAENTDYEANTAEDGSGSDISTDIGIVITKFVTAAKMVITNNNAATAYLVNGSGDPFLKLRGKLALTVDTSVAPPKSFELLEEYTDSDSVNKFDEQEYTINNNFIDTTTQATYLAQALVDKYKDPFRRIIIKIQGVPQIQLRDKVSVEDITLDAYKDYRVMQIQGFLQGGIFTQNLVLREITDAEDDS